MRKSLIVLGIVGIIGTIYGFTELFKRITFFDFGVWIFILGVTLVLFALSVVVLKGGVGSGY